jgi:hypothetical protein
MIMVSLRTWIRMFQRIFSFTPSLQVSHQQSHSHSQREIGPVVALAVYLLYQYLLLGDILSRGSSSSSRGRLTPVRGAHASRAPTSSAKGKTLSTTINFARKRGRGNQ